MASVRPKTGPEPESPYPTFAAGTMKRYYSFLDNVWNRLPAWAGPSVASALVLLMGLTIRAEWLMILVHFLKWTSPGNGTVTSAAAAAAGSITLSEWMNVRFAGFTNVWLIASFVGYAIYFGVGGFLHWYYYRLRRESAHEWKCQPDKWLPPDLEWHEIKIGSISLFIGNTLSAALVIWILNDGYSTVYYNISDYGWTWFLLSWPLIFCYQDYLTYLTHRLYHTPFLYKHFHKLHHTYKQPTAFSVTAIHPFEFVNVQAILVSPMFFMPVHWVTMTVLMLYIYYHGIIHGTYRRKDRIYREDIYYGKGKELEKCTEEELSEEMSERTSENVAAYQSEADKQEMVQTVQKRMKKPAGQ
ncbi:Delta(7)-sterol 5(6)-desaturase erg31 [Amphibalanus amphitrite]|uniref:Delta(7)-sterol 5(6)-desaturase erg31 n=1 Tax=Amphibalanus amphitrite TaxID=1232801 RepID=A0A6A4WK31_AMPAM|nr:Delta(7)-sterol 5(6)-desaturase erg31 [Amphibalanus amphitrite]